MTAETGKCPATRGTQRCASIGLHARHVWVDAALLPDTPQPRGLVTAVREAVHAVWCQPDCHVPGHGAAEPLDEAQALAAIAAVRAWDAQQPAPTGVPTCHGEVWLPIATGSNGGYSRPCTLPLGHHGGCR